jgi:D-alanyl-lipoteichoic acid acyltransferase DltB (MBOAT superfamily)
MPLSKLFLYDPREPLLFTGGQFLLWFSVFYAGFVFVRSRTRARFAWLLSFSWFFYYKCSGVFVVALWATTLADFLLAQRIAAAQTERARRAWLVFSVALSGGLLVYFKYTNFLAGGLAHLVGARFEPFDIALPAGISFYTFQSLSYLVDVYRRRFEPTRSFVEYATYLAYFPQIVAGPIVRADELFAELRRPDTDDPTAIASGVFRIVTGVVKKAVLADYLGLYVDRVFGGGAGLSSLELALGVYAYSLQIYLDFSGYSDIAVGLGRLMGISLPENFDTPYAARSITEFWRRWHMTLSAWLRDYVYIPLGGNRRGPARRTLNLLATMAFGGLWHGASMSFVLWGTAHGVLLCGEKAAPPRLRRLFEGRAGRVVAWLLTFHAVTLLWILFRAGNVSGAVELVTRIVRDFDLSPLWTVWVARRGLFAALGAGAALSLLPRPTDEALARGFARAPVFAKAVVVLIVAQLTVELRSTDVQPFIYFQF